MAPALFLRRRPPRRLRYDPRHDFHDFLQSPPLLLCPECSIPLALYIFRFGPLNLYNDIARLAQSAERKTLNLVVVGSSPTLGEKKKFPLMEHTWYSSITCEFALLAQLVARGSDKAKVIGSSPVESNKQNKSELFLSRRHFFFTSCTSRQKKFLTVSIAYNAS